MKTALLLFLQLGMAITYLSLSPCPFGLNPENTQGLLFFWQESLELLSIPFCLLLFSFSRKPLFVIAKGAWGFWSALISLGVLGWYSQVPLVIPFLGTVFLALYGILGFSLGLHSGFEWMKQFKSSGPMNRPSPLLAHSPGTRLEHPSETLPKVEGI